MDIKLLWFWAAVQCLSAVNAAESQDCLPPDIPNGFFVTEQNAFSDHTQLYYGCDLGFKPVEGDWWGTVVCQNGNWTSVPLCISESSCFDPEIANANYTKFPFVKDGFKGRIKCNYGYEDKKKNAVALCQNGAWTKIPVCEKIESWCELPTQIPNGVVINQVQDMFAEEEQVEYACQRGYELETSNNKATCSYGQWISLPSCRKKQNAGTPGDNHGPLFVPIEECPPPPTVQNAEYYADESGMFLTYRCSYWYKLNGSSIVRCMNGQWTHKPTCDVNFCKLETNKYPYLENIGEKFVLSGTQEDLKCVNKSWRYSRVVCKDNKLFLSECCYSATHYWNKCQYNQLI
ncbi:unnamed protein product [Knipowitschia caucasica]